VSNHAIFLHDRQGAVTEIDASRIDVILAFEFLKMQARVRGIALELPIRAFRLSLNVGGQPGK
jgi:hypothetical protein